MTVSQRDQRGRFLPGNTMAPTVRGRRFKARDYEAAIEQGAGPEDVSKVLALWTARIVRMLERNRADPNTSVSWREVEAWSKLVNGYAIGRPTQRMIRADVSALDELKRLLGPDDDEPAGEIVDGQVVDEVDITYGVGEDTT